MNKQFLSKTLSIVLAISFALSNSGMLIPKTAEATSYTITVTKDGSGSGTVTDNYGKIDCGSDCIGYNYGWGTNVTLTATADSESYFAGWSGDCSGTNTTCVINVKTNKSVTATFESKKVDICHAKPPETAANGYDKMNVDKNATAQGHDGHNADIIPSYSYLEWEVVGYQKVCPPGYPHPSTQHPDYCYKTNNPDWPNDYALKIDDPIYGWVTHSYTGKNWDTNGQAIWNNNCVVPQSCGDGQVNGNEVCEQGDFQSCTTQGGYNGTQYCLSDCSGWDTCKPTEYCGDHTINDSEQCEDPNTSDNNYCSQTTTQCTEGNKTQTRDGYGNCNGTCGCAYDDWSTPTCVKDSCKASCAIAEDCDDSNPLTTDYCNLDSCQCKNTQVPLMAISASKVICDNEADLPNWGTGSGIGYPSGGIDQNTASNYVSTHSGCHLEGWGFEWAYDGVANPGDTLYDPAGLPNWHLFDVNSPAQITDLKGKTKIWVREVLENGYIPFTYGPQGNKNTDNYSAELYCHTDVLNYDNYDYISSPLLGTTYYCVGFNTSIKYNCDREKWQCAPSREGQYPNEDACKDACKPVCGDGKREGDEECDPPLTTTPGPQDTSFCSQQCKLVPIYQGGTSCPAETNPVKLEGYPIDILGNDIDGQTITLTGGKTYLFNTSGTFRSSSGAHKSDAGYTTIDDWANRATQFGIQGTPPDYAAHALLGDLGLGVGVINWGDYNSNHTYNFSYTIPTGSSSAQFVIGDRWDNWFNVSDPSWNNQGGMGDNLYSLSLDVYECIPENPPETGSITACKYYDTNKDGEYDSGTDTPLVWNITLWYYPDPAGHIINSTTTDPVSGCVEFNDLPYGTYTVHEDQIGGWMQTAPHPDGSPTVYLNSGNSHPIINFLNYETATSGSITICKYEDKGVIGQYEPGTDNTPLAWNIRIDYWDGKTTQTGYYNTDPVTGCIPREQLANLPFGLYTISESPVTGWLQSYPPANGTYSITIDSEHTTFEPVIFLNYLYSAPPAGGPGPTGSYVPLVLGAATQQGQVAGASTACNPYLLKYIKLGADNDPEEVKKLESFLNEYLGVDLPIDGIYDQADYNAVKQFQLLLKDDVLAPWVLVGCLPSDISPTGYVYRTTKWTINNFFCPELKPDVSDETCTGGIIIGLGEGEGTVLGEATTTPTTTETIPPETTETTVANETPEAGATPSQNWLWYLIGIIVIGGAVYLAYSRRKK